MAKIIVVADARTVRDDVRSVIDDGVNEIVELQGGREVRAAASADPPDLVIADAQIQNMGGVAVCMDLKLEASGGRLPEIPVLILLDRRADVFVARRCGADGYLVKPLDPIRLRKAVAALLDGGRYDDRTYAPATVPATR